MQHKTGRKPQRLLGTVTVRLLRVKEKCRFKVKLPREKTPPKLLVSCHIHEHGPDLSPAFPWHCSAWDEAESTRQEPFQSAQVQVFKEKSLSYPQKQTFPHLKLEVETQISVPAKLFTGAVTAAEQDPKSLRVHVLASMKSRPFPRNTFRNVHVFLLFPTSELGKERYL